MSALRSAPRRSLLVVSAALLSLLLAPLACSNETDRVPLLPPGDAPFSFRDDVQPIFTRTCALAGCHGGGALGFPLDLSPGTAYGQLVDVPSIESPLDRVEPGAPDLSYLVHKLQGTYDAAGGACCRMPLGQAALPDAEIGVIRSWIEQGAADN